MGDGGRTPAAQDRQGGDGSSVPPALDTQIESDKHGMLLH